MSENTLGIEPESCLHCMNDFVVGDIKYEYCSENCRQSSLVKADNLLNLLYSDKALWDKVHRTLVLALEHAVAQKIGETYQAMAELRLPVSDTNLFDEVKSDSVSVTLD